MEIVDEVTDDIVIPCVGNTITREMPTPPLMT